MNLQNIKYIYLLGIGGIGMSALARYFHSSGKIVSGYDKTPTPLTDALIKEGITIYFEDRIDLLPDWLDAKKKEELLIIYTPAIPSGHLQYNFLIENNYPIAKRSVVLGWITQQSFTIAVAGTHGKTTTSAIITHLLKYAGMNCTAFLGGISVNYNSNLILGNYEDENNKPMIIVEADEFDRSFLTLHPDIAVVTSMDADHLDIYGDKNHLEESYRLFAKQVKANGDLISKSGLPLSTSIAKHFLYSITGEATFATSQIEIKNHQYNFNLQTPAGRINDLMLGMPGRHNVENAVAAIAVAYQLGIPHSKIKEGLSSFKGVKRRFEYHVQTERLTYIDDYAHHPEELRATISSVKELYSDKKITGVFQPHLFTRTRDFAEGFAQSLSLLDSLIMLDIYPARELPIAGVSAQMILDKVKCNDKKIYSKQELLSAIADKKPEVLLTLGAGDIDQLVEPIKNILT